MFCVCLVCNAQTEKWDYPLKPGMEEWYRLETGQESIDALQVPEDVLAKLSSDELVRLCIIFPAFGIFGAFNTPQDGFAVMVERYNLFRHLLSRKDVGGSLIAAYKDASLSGFKTLPYSNDFWSIKLYYFELLLSQKEILQSLTPDEKLELITEARSKFSAKMNSEEHASPPGALFSIRIMASILDVEESPELNASSNRGTATQFIQTGRLNDASTANEIISITDIYIRSKK